MKRLIFDKIEHFFGMLKTSADMTLQRAERCNI